MKHTTKQFERLSMSIDQRSDYDRMCKAVRTYFDKYHRPIKGRHQRTTVTFVGDKFKAETFDCRYYGGIKDE